MFKNTSNHILSQRAEINVIISIWLKDDKHLYCKPSWLISPRIEWNMFLRAYLVSVCLELRNFECYATKSKNIFATVRSFHNVYREFTHFDEFLQEHFQRASAQITFSKFDQTSLELTNSTANWTIPGSRANEISIQFHCNNRPVLIEIQRVGSGPPMYIAQIR